MKPHPLIGLVDESAIDITCHGDLQIVQSGGGEGNSMWPTAALNPPWRFQTRFSSTVFEDLKAKWYPHLVSRVGHNVGKLTNAFKWWSTLPNLVPHTRSIKVLQNLQVADDEILHQQSSTVYAHNSKASISFTATRHTLTSSKSMGQQKAFSYFEAEQLRAARDVNFTEVAEEVRDENVIFQVQVDLIQVSFTYQMNAYKTCRYDN